MLKISNLKNIGNNKLLTVAAYELSIVNGGQISRIGSLGSLSFLDNLDVNGKLPAGQDYRSSTFISGDLGGGFKSLSVGITLPAASFTKVV
jgi:hypothetical protein